MAKMSDTGDSSPGDLLAEEEFSPLGGRVLQLHESPSRSPAHRNAINIAVDRRGEAADLDLDQFDALVTSRADARDPWIVVPEDRLDQQLGAIQRNARAAPMAASVLGRLLRVTEKLDVQYALEVESMAYSMLLGGREFLHWLERPRSDKAVIQDTPPVRYERDNDTVTLTLASPGNRNAMTAAMRDALFEALVNVLEDPSAPRLVLNGEGRCFSVGGYLPEFGTARDLAGAHVVRTLRSCARILHLLGERAEVRVHGACIGSGIEIAAAAGRRVAAPDAFVQLPEVSMGLIPGAGGTVTISRAIGRHRTFWMALGGFRINAAEALKWGLFHAITP